MKTLQVAVLMFMLLSGCGDGTFEDEGSNGGSITSTSSPTTPWTLQLGTSSRDEANGVATDSWGNVYVTGHTLGGLDGETNAGGIDIFVVKYNSSGTKQWTMQNGRGAQSCLIEVGDRGAGDFVQHGFCR